MKQNVTGRGNQQQTNNTTPCYAGLGIGLIGMKAAESTGRNPGSFGKVLTISILLAALVEGVAFVAIFMG